MAKTYPCKTDTNWGTETNLGMGNVEGDGGQRARDKEIDSAEWKWKTKFNIRRKITNEVSRDMWDYLNDSKQGENLKNTFDSNKNENCAIYFWEK